jgi:hypothetical protein
MTSSQVNVSETPPMSAEDLQTLAKNETDDNGLILGKFKSVEDLAASYKELEGKLGQVSEEDQATEETEEQTQEEGEFDAEEYYGDGLASVLEEVGIDAQDITQRFTDTGEISEDDYSKLGEAGFSKQVVDTYLDGLRGVGEGDEIPTQQIQNIKDSVGGDQAYEQMADWCQQNLSEQEIKAFDKITETADAPVIQLAVEGLYTRYQNAMGVEPDLVTGRPAASGPNPYRSTAEVVAAMSDKRYGKDVSYTEDVQNRLAGSDVFKT